MILLKVDQKRQETTSSIDRNLQISVFYVTPYMFFTHPVYMVCW